jgi:hypothetical protein
MRSSAEVYLAPLHVEQRMNRLAEGTRGEQLAAMPHDELVKWALKLESFVPAYSACLAEIEGFKAAARKLAVDKGALQEEVERLKIVLQLT